MSELSNEDRYFMQKDEELRAKMRAELEQKAQELEHHEAVSEHTGINDESTSKHIKDLGFDADTIPVLHLMPLVAVAWADGEVSHDEKEVILSAASAHGIEPGTPAATLLTSMLEVKPSDAVAHQVLEVLREILIAKDMHPHSIVEACLDVAQASGGFFGLGNKVSGDEKELIEKISATFNADKQKEISELLDL